MNKPTRVVVWGPGGLGRVRIREISLLKEFQLVGVRTYGASNNGVDAGELAGVGRLGIRAQSNVAEVLHAAVATLLKAVPMVMKASPGILKAFATPIHWLPDPRNL